MRTNVIKLSTFIFSMLLCSVSWAQVLPDFTKLVEQASPSVVKITTKTEVEYRRSSREEDILRYFFGEVPQMPQQPKNQQGLGSGFIFLMMAIF